TPDGLGRHRPVRADGTRLRRRLRRSGRVRSRRRSCCRRRRLGARSRGGLMKELTPDQRAEVLERHLHDEGHVDSAAIDRTVAAREEGGGPSPALGARIVARAWPDPEFKTRLLANGTATVSELARQLVPIAVLEDTPERHHVIVCTL